MDVDVVDIEWDSKLDVIVYVVSWFEDIVLLVFLQNYVVMENEVVKFGLDFVMEVGVEFLLVLCNIFCGKVMMLIVLDGVL